LGLLFLSSGCFLLEEDRPEIRPGTYEVSFFIRPSPVVPGGLIGNHEFTFRTTDADDEESFVLLSSRHVGRTLAGDPSTVRDNYLDPDRRGVIAGNQQWRVQWYVGPAAPGGIAVRVTLHPRSSPPGFSLPFGCNGVQGETMNFPGEGCTVRRLD